MTDQKDKPTAHDELQAMMQKMLDNAREMTEFKNGELTPEEEEMVKREGLSRLSYIPLQVMQNQAKAFSNPPPPLPPEVAAANRLRKELSDRFDGFGYGMFLLIILTFTWAVVNGHGWFMGIFCFVLMVAVLELSYRLQSR